MRFLIHKRKALSFFGILSAIFLLTGLTAENISAQDKSEKAISDREQKEISSDQFDLNKKIRQILVKGNQRVETDTILSYLLVKPGERFDPKQLDLSLKTLYRTGLFSDVVFNEQNEFLIVNIIENPIINRVILEGNKSLKDDKITDEIQAKPRAVFTKAKIQDDLRRIIELYRISGRFAAIVTPKIVQQPQNRIDVIFEISEGPKTGIKKISFFGNKVFSDKKLRSKIVTTESKLWKIFSTNDNYDPNRLDYDRQKIREFYTNQGYANFKVISVIAELSPDQSYFNIVFTIDEGEKYKFGEVKVKTDLKSFKKGSLKKSLRIKEGQEYKFSSIQSAVDNLTYLTGAIGYAFVDIRPLERLNKEDKIVDITFDIREGPRVYIERINVIGNTRTIDRVVRRELRLAEGDPFNKALVERSRINIRALGFFKEVEIEERRGSRADSVILDVKVTEQSTGDLSFGVAYNTVNSWLLELSATERNFRGRGQYLRLGVATSSRTQRIDLRFTEPRFLDRNLAASIEVYSVKTNYLKEASFETQRNGISTSIAFPISDRARMSLSYSLKNEDVKVGGSRKSKDGTCPITDPICRQEGKRLYSILGYSLRWDYRNDPIIPTGGFDFSFGQNFAGLGGDVKYIRTEASGGLYYGIYKRSIIASLSGSAGYISGWADQDLIPINDRFFLTPNTFRGFDTAGLGPRIITTDSKGRLIPGDALGAKLYAVGTLEISFPLGLPKEYGILGSVFTDFGTAGLLDDRDKLDNVRYDASFRASVGVSIFWESPFGPVRFDFSKVVVKEEYDRTESFRFGIGKRF